MKATIHQPDFLPWLGLFDKIAHSDCWIVLDHVENNPRDAAFWGRRVSILVNGRATWLSVPLNKPTKHGVIGVPIRDMTINTAIADLQMNALKTIRMAYANAPFFSRYFHFAEAYFSDLDQNLMRRNMRFIEGVMRLLGIHTQIIYSSTLDVHTRSTQLLIDLLKKVGADTYRCGSGAQGYQEDHLFAKQGIILEYNNFQHPSYRQLRAPTFVPGLSILDALFFAGEETVASWVTRS
ncbi:MAG: WbqC family protein [Elusimicrobia bacterium]|nr:WbqC family protein [Elusimicrobiota bacterium]